MSFSGQIWLESPRLIALVIDYIDQRCGKGAKLPETTAVE
jgi:hypothetical protein